MIGGISVKSASVSADDCQILLDFLTSKEQNVDKMCKIQSIIRKCAPFAAALPGTEMWFNSERKKLKSFVNSPITCSSGAWCWFYTASQSIEHSSLLYDNFVINDDNRYDKDKIRLASDALTKSQRSSFIRANPVLPVRIWQKQQDQFIKHIINGHSKPLGGSVCHWAGRDEVQQRGCIHTHYVLCVEGLQTQDHTYGEPLLLVKNTVTAMLIYDCREFTYLPDRSDPDPRLLRFDATLDYELDDLYPRDPVVRRLVCDLQLSDAYMHKCKESCFKYCKKKRKCRYGYPFSASFETDEPTVCQDRDTKGRPRLRILPARNNANVAPSPVSALFNIAQNGNTNIQYITSIYGALEYITNYVTKMERGDSNEVINLAIKLLTVYDEPVQALLNAVNSGRIVSNTEASCYLLGYPGLKYTSSFKFVSSKPSVCLSNVLDLHTKTQTSSSNMKLRAHYAEFVQIQEKLYENCLVPLYSFASSFSTVSEPCDPKDCKPPPLFETGSCGSVSNAVSFKTPNVKFSAHRAPKIIHISPYVKFCSSEESYFSQLLLFVPWQNGLEQNICDEGNAEKTWELCKTRGTIPEFAFDLMERDLAKQSLDLQPVRSDETDSSSVSSDDDIQDEMHQKQHPQQQQQQPYLQQPTQLCHGVSVDMSQYNVYTTFVDKLKKELSNEQQAKLNESEIAMLDSGKFVAADKSDILQLEIAEETSKLNNAQRDVFEQITTTMLQEPQMVGFVSGEGGVGKSLLISLMRKWCSYVYGKSRGSSCAVCAFTGPAAYNVRGETWHSMFCKKKNDKKVLTSKQNVECGAQLRAKFEGVRLLIIDELSLIGLSSLWETHVKLQIAANCAARAELPWGGYHILFVGDLFQLPPPFDSSLVLPAKNVFKHRARELFLNSLNVFYELTKNERAGEDLPFISALSHLRQGLVDTKDRQTLSSLICSRDYCLQNELDARELWLFPTNKEVNLHNADMLKRQQKNNFSIRIISQHTSTKCKASKDEAQLLLTSRSRDADTLPCYLDLAIGSRVRLTKNLCVSAGLVNGAQGVIEKIVFKNMIPDKLLPSNDELHLDIEDREIPVVLVKFDDVLKRGVGSEMDVYPIAAVSGDAGLRVAGKVFKRFALPLVLGHARTAHSVQGLTAKYGVTTKLSNTFFNYNYVTLSRGTCAKNVRVLVPEGSIHVFKSEWAQPVHSMRLSVMQFYEHLRLQFAK